MTFVLGKHINIKRNRGGTPRLEPAPIQNIIKREILYEIKHRGAYRCNG